MGGVLLYGYGNPGRGDDGLGPALAEALAARGLPRLKVETGFQLDLEDVCGLRWVEAVVFADAATLGEEPFFFRRLGPGEPASFSSHSLSPAGLLALAERLYGVRPRAWLLGIRGYDFDGFGAPLSLRARNNLKQAAEFLEERLGDADLLGAAPAA